MTPELIAHYMDVFGITPIFNGLVVAVVVIAIVGIAIATFGGRK